MRASIISTALFFLIPITSALPSFPTLKPAPANATRSLAARDSDEIIYLANCYRNAYWTAGYKASFALWYPQWWGNIKNPGAISFEYRDWGNGGDWLHWETGDNAQQEIHWPPNGDVVLYTHIATNGNTVGFKNYAGYAWRWNNGWQQFNCYKDDERMMFQDAVNNYIDYHPDDSDMDRLVCQPIYWCHY